MKSYAYARVSSTDQNLERQFEAFKSFGIEEKNIFADKQSGKDFERINYKKLLKKLKKDDLLVIKSIDRLGRNYDGIIKEWNNLSNIIGVKIVVLDMPLLDTRNTSNTLVGKFISDVVLQILSFVAENERINIKERQKEGILLAQKRGIKFGRPQKVYESEFLEIVNNYLNKQIDLKQALKLSGYKRDNFFYHIRKIKNCKKF
ncbi:MAG: recombinase family protein [Clostridia bacterium]|nr:recombinase family protein [Clostridia bacterium]